MRRWFVILTAMCWTTAAAQADNWPGWRGPTGQGLSLDKDVPLTWSPKENVRWKVALAAPGNSTPIIWGDRVFITQASDKTLWPPKVPKDFPKNTSPGGAAIAEKRSVLCFERTTGKLLWQRDVIYKEPEATHSTNPFCSASPVTDGERVIASHGSAGLVCYDFEGKQLWHYDVGKLEHVWGNASSPVLHDDLCIVHCGPGERQFLLAVNKKTGAKVWETPEPDGDAGLTSGKFLGSWSSTIIGRVGDADHVIHSMPFRLKGYDPKTGQELWSAKVGGTYAYSSPLFRDNIAILGSALVKLGGKGDITKDQLKHKVGAMYISTAVLAGDYLYTYGGVGVPACYEWKTGKELWKDQITDRPGGTDTWGSLVHAAGRVYIADRQGNTHVFAAGPKYQHLATNQLGEPMNASVAIAHGDVFLRTHKHLWCFTQEPGKAAKAVKLNLSLLSGGAKEDLDALRDALKKVAGIKFNADDIQFADFGRDGGTFTRFFSVEIPDRAKTDLGAIAKVVAAANTSKKERTPAALFLIIRYRPDSTNNEKLRAALAKVKGVQAEKSWAGDQNLWVNVDGSGQGKLVEIIRALHEARIPIRDPILDSP
jgi:outer membrane protein assembly factor BamB